MTKQASDSFLPVTRKEAGNSFRHTTLEETDTQIDREREKWKIKRNRSVKHSKNVKKDSEGEEHTTGCHFKPGHW